VLPFLEDAPFLGAAAGFRAELVRGIDDSDSV